MELRRIPTIPDDRQFPKPKGDFAALYRQELDDLYKYASDPYQAWRRKRQDIKERLDKEAPNYTQDQLYNVYEALGLGDSTNPGDFTRGEGILESGSRALQTSWNVAGSMIDSAQQWMAGEEDMDEVMLQQKQMDEKALENELIRKYQSQTAHGKNAITQFLFDLASSAPIMVGVMGLGAAGAVGAKLAGLPVWLGGLLAYGAADALSEMGFNWADIMTNPRVRKKIEDALGEELSEGDEQALKEETQKILMEEAEGSAAQVGILNFMNPLNWNPVASKFSKLMKIGSGRMGTIGRQALGDATRETIEEFGQSVVSQYSAAEAQMKAMSRAGVKDIPEIEVDLKRAGYESLMGFAVGGTIGGFRGSRGYSKYFDAESDVLDVDERGNPIFKKPNEKGYVGAGALRMQARRMIDADNPVELNDWLNGTDADGKPNLDAREKLVVNDEIKKMRVGQTLLGDKTRPEKLEQRKENANRFEEYKKDPEAWIESQKSPEQKEAEQAQREAEVKQLSDSYAEVESLIPEPPTEVQYKKTKALVHDSVVPAISSILKTPSTKRTPRQKEFLKLAQENPEMEYKDLDKMVTQIVSQMEKYGTQPVKPPPQAPKETKGGKGKPKDTDLTNKEKEAQLLEQIFARTVGLDKRVTDVKERVDTDTRKQDAKDPQVTGGATLADPQATGGATLADTPAISEGILNKNDSKDEIMNALKPLKQQNLPYSWKEINTLVLNEIRDLKKAQGIKPIKNVKLPDKIDKKTGEIKTGRVQKTDYRLSADDRLIVLNNVSKKLGVSPPKVAVGDPDAQGEAVTSPNEVVEPGKKQYEKAEAAVKELEKYKKNVDANNKEIDFDSDLDGLNQVIGTEILIERADDSAKKSYVLLQDQYDAAPRGENEQAGVRKSDQLKANPGTKTSRIMFMGFNKDGVPYFNSLGQRQDRTGQTAKDVNVKEKEVFDRGAVAHLLGGTNKSFRNVNERKEGKKKFLVAEVSYTTAAPLEDTLASSQATQLIAIENDLSGWNTEAEEIEAKGEAATPEEISRYDELVEKIAAHNEEKALLLEQVKNKRDKVQVREGTGVKKEYIPLNALGTTERDINTRKKNLRKLLKEHKNKETLPNEEVDRVFNDIEIVLGKDQLEMDRDYGIEISQVTETKEIKDAEGNPKTVSVTIPSLKMAKSSPLDTSTLNYVLGFNGWRLVNPEMDAMTDNEFEVVVGDTVQVRGVPKFENDIIVDGVNYTQQDKDHAKFLNLKLEEQLKIRKDREKTVSKKDAKKQADKMLEELDKEIQEGSLPGSAWKRSARQWFKTAAAQKNPPKKGRQGKSGWTTKKAIDMVRQQMKALDGVTNKEVDSMIDDQILEFLWEGPGEVGRPTVATTVVYDSANPDHKGFNVDVKFKNGVTEEIVPRWGQSIKSYQTLAEVIAASNATGAQVDLKPQGGKKGKKTPTKKATTKKTKTDDKKETKYSDKELKALQDRANKIAEEETTDEVIDSDGNKYVGELKDGVFHGQGTYTFPSGEKYVGEWKDGKKHGQGTYTFPDGEKYVGEYKNGEKDGQGTWTSPNGEKYVGEYKDDKRNGKGTYTWPDGDKYVGEFKDAKRHGQGTQSLSDGSKQYEGEWKDGKAWSGTSYDKDGNTIGIWSKGKETPAKTEAETTTEEVTPAKTEAETTTEEVTTTPAETTGENTLGQISEGELKAAMPDADAKKYNNARFDKLKGEPRYQDVSVWDASALPQKKGEETKVLTAQIKLDLAEDKPAGVKALKDLIHRKLQDYLVLEVQTEENIEGLRNEIDERYWDLLGTDNKKAVNTALVARGSTPLPLIRPKSRTTTSKKKVKTEAPPIERAGFITDNVASATITDIPTANPKLNDIWVIDPNEVKGLFIEEASKSEKNLEELEGFLTLINNGDFFVVKKTDNWSKAYILLRGDFAAPTKGKRGKKIPVPQAIKTRLSREGKFFNAQREDFPRDKQGKIKQRSRKLAREELTNLKGTLSSELFMQLFRSESVDLNVLQKALDEDRIIFAHDAGIDNFIEVTWKGEDGKIRTPGKGSGFNMAVLEFKDRSAIEGFIADLRKKDPTAFDLADKEYKKMLDKEASQDIAGQVYEEFTDATRSYIDNGGLRSLHNDGTIESAERPLESNDSINTETSSSMVYDSLYDPAAEAETVQGNIRKAQRAAGTAKTLQQKIDEREAENIRKGEDKTVREKMYEENMERLRREAEKDGSVKRLAEPVPEGAEPVPLEVVNDIVGKFREEFPGSADITVEMGDSPGFKGLYVPEESGRKARIYLVANEHYSAEDVVQTLWHEGVGHGMQSLMSPQKFLELQQIVETSMPERFAEELKIVEENPEPEWGELSNEQKRSIAAQEVIADFANNLEGQSPTIIESITAWLRSVYNNFAKALGLNQLNLSEGDVRAILFESADAFRNPRPEGRTDIYTEGAFTADVDTSLRRRSFESKGTPFENTNLREASRSAWEKMYGVQTADTAAPAGSWWRNIRESLLATIFDPFRVIKNEIGAEEYMVTRLAGRADGIITTLLRFGGVNVQQRDLNGTLVNETHVNRKMKSLFQMLRPLGTAQERQRFFGWIAYNRAKNLLKQGRETFFTAQEINEGLTWNQGRIKNAETGVVGSREIIYERIQKEVAAMNNSVVDMGVKMGLLSKKSADNFAKDFYIPFYRIIEEEIGDGKQGNNVDYNSLTGQQGVKKLKGSKRPIGDPFNNLLHNWLHIIDASVKNDAANTTIKSALEIKNPMDSSEMLVEPASITKPKTVRVKQDGKDKLFNINNQLLYNALTALSTDTKFPGFKYAISAKGLFTQVITANPLFKYNNIIRDTITTAGTTDVGFNLFKNAVGGFRSLSKNQADMLVSGGYIQFAYTRGDDPKYAEKLLNKELSTGYIVENPETDKTFQEALAKATKMSRNLWGWYNKQGDKLENANRAAVFESLLEKGKSQTEAAFASRDLMDFTLHGGASWVRLITSLTPFANAMLQGKYKLGRAVVNNPKPALIVGSAVLLAQLFEGMLHEDDEEYQRRPDWEKDTFWWVPIPGTDIKFLIPKPHEFAMVGNFAWRALQIAEEEGGDAGEALVSGIKSVVSREFGIVPIAQVIKPLVEVGMNRNLFFDRDIEPLGSQGRSPSMRYGQYTSETAIVASRLLELSPFKIFNLSPYQLEHLINGYFGWMGQLVLGVADMVTSTTGDFPVRPARRLRDTPMARRIFKASPIRNTKMATVFYDRLKEMEQTTQDMNLARRQGDMKRWREIYEDTKAARQYNIFLKQQRRIVNDINAQIESVRYSREKWASPYWKALNLDRLYQMRNDAIDNATKHAAFR